MMDTELVSRYTGNVLPGKAVYPARFVPYAVLLATSKLARSFGIFLAYDILKLIHVVQFLFFINLGAAVCFVLVQKPATGRKISKRQWFRIIRHALIGNVINLLWLYALTLCGPLRTLLMFEHSDHIVIAVACALFTHSSSPARFRGAILFMVAFFGIMLFDHDLERRPLTVGTSEQTSHNIHESLITHIFNHITNLTGLSDHKGGALLLLVTLCMSVGFNTASKKLSLDIGGVKRLHALSTLVSTILLLPWATILYYTSESLVESWSSLFVPIGIVTVLVLVVDYYIESACLTHLDVAYTGQIGTTAVLAGAILLSAVWTHPLVNHVATILDMNQLITTEHEISAGVVISAVLFAIATHSLSQPLRGSSRGTLIGYSAAGPPLYSFAGEAIQRTSQSVIVVARNGLRQIIEESDSRRIFYFLCINLCFTFVELIYGAWTNSLGLISDGFHMLFDCSALVMGLYAAVMSHWKATRNFSFGYDRVEILSGFINGLFLMVIAFFVFTAALARMFDPPTIKTDRLLFVSVGGLCVNLVGIVAFHHNHSHVPGHSHASHGHSHGAPAPVTASHSHSHSHSHGSPSGHSHSCSSASTPAPSPPAHNTNMEGVFLHVLADTLGSVGVIISTLLIENFGWNIADPVCSLFIASLIFVSVLPLVRETAVILLLRTPLELQRSLTTVFHKLLSIDGVVSYSEEHFWRHSSRVLCGTIHVQLEPDASEQKVVSQVSGLLKEAGVSNMCVQVEKRVYFQHLIGLGVTMDRMHAMTSAFKTLSHENTTADFINDL